MSDLYLGCCEYYEGVQYFVPLRRRKKEKEETENVTKQDRDKSVKDES